MFRTVMYILITTLVDTTSRAVNTETLTTSTTLMRTFGNDYEFEKLSQATIR